MSHWAGRFIVALAVLVLVPCSTGLANAATPGGSAGHALVYYLSLGDSLAQGVQPNSSGQSVETDQGYADDLLAAGQATFPTLRLVKLGCPGETTSTLVTGGICTYPLGSQLAQAVSFLHAHRGFVAFVTIDIGANDIDGCVADGEGNPACVDAAFASVSTNLPTILGKLRSAAGPAIPIIGMNYYDPFLAAWLQGTAGQTLAVESEQLAVQYNGVLDSIYGGAGSAVADVQDAFSTTDFTDMVSLPGIGGVPLNVARICEWTWMCAASPLGPNIHANTTGYEQIAEAFQTVLPA
jgi:lysophospholipase L1-like esterase